MITLASLVLGTCFTLTGNILADDTLSQESYIIIGEQNEEKTQVIIIEVVSSTFGITWPIQGIVSSKALLKRDLKQITCPTITA